MIVFLIGLHMLSNNSEHKHTSAELRDAESRESLAVVPIAKRLGASGMGVDTRVMGMVLAAIAIGMLAEGLKSLLPGLAG